MTLPLTLNPTIPRMIRPRTRSQNRGWLKCAPIPVPGIETVFNDGSAVAERSPETGVVPKPYAVLASSSISMLAYANRVSIVKWTYAAELGAEL